MQRGDWWHSDDGENMLRGVITDPDNPPRLPDDYIMAFLTRIPEARDAFNRMVPNMLWEEQERLNALYHQIEDKLVVDPVLQSDYIQNKWNKANIKVCGKYGGTRRGGNR